LSVPTAEVNVIPTEELTFEMVINSVFGHPVVVIGKLNIPFTSGLP
jgi:hypothetical protein